MFCLIYGFVQQSALSLEFRRVNKQLQEARDLAQKAERSRYVELKSDLQKHLLDLQNQSAARHSALVARIDNLQEAMDSSTQETVNSLSASVGEVEDRLAQLVQLATEKHIEVRDKEAPASNNPEKK